MATAGVASGSVVDAAVRQAKTVKTVKPTLVVVVTPTPTRTPTPTPCVVTFDCSIKKVVDATCAAKSTKQVACTFTGTVYRVGAATTCFLETTTLKACKATVVEKRTCAKLCPTPTPTPTPCLVRKDCSFLRTETFDCSTTALVTVTCPRTSEFFDAAGKPLKVCKKNVTTKKTCTREVRVKRTCAVPCPSPTPTPTPKKVTKTVEGKIGVVIVSFTLRPTPLATPSPTL
ncbi:hypothetical protein H3U06_18330, partial [Clostridioides difficile]|nr:hypothetical protein [Clostridioides difficile]